MVILFRDFLQPFSWPVNSHWAGLFPLVITGTSYSMPAVIGLLLLLRIVSKTRSYWGTMRRSTPDASVPWSAPIEWSGLNVSAWSISGLSGRCFRVPVDGIPERCAV